LQPALVRKVVVHTDASFHRDSCGLPCARLCYIICAAAEGVKRGAVIDVPLAVFSSFEQRNTQIAMAEGLAPMMVAYFEPNLLRECYAIFFIDNMSVMCSAVLGHSTQIDMSCIIFALYLRLAELQCRPWWEYVPSDSNIADGGSRVGTSDPVAAKAGNRLEYITSFPSWPADFLHTQVADWKDFWSWLVGRD